MSSEPERIFNGGRCTISDHRARLGDDIIEPIECLKSWFREEISCGDSKDIVDAEKMLLDLQMTADELQL
ncbi:hypothetical protein BDD12DRAFT_909537 [Trichophaea hybrida]|nr:hypothetical protein BDD12DRAFT_909537 [Trichophaea hybrida]